MKNLWTLKLTLCCGTAWYLAGPLLANDSLRVATFNVSLFGNSQGELLSRLHDENDPQICAIAEIIQRARPDVLFLNELDYVAPAEAPVGAGPLALLQTNFLAKGQNRCGSPGGAAEPIEYRYSFVAPSNTGIHSGYDLDRNGRVEPKVGSEDYGGDSWGFGRFPGQYGMAVLSRYPIDEAKVRTFRRFLWKDMPGALLPDDDEIPEPGDWYPPEVLERFPLSSKSHWDVPIRVGDRTIHLLASHPTPPVYDGPEDRNGRRNHDEIRFWADYVGPSEDAAYIYDDAGNHGGLAPGAVFVVVGDLNSDPHDGEGSAGIRQLMESTRVRSEPIPYSPGGAEQANLQGGANAGQRGDPHHDTVDPPDRDGPGNLRLDYVLPSIDLTVSACGVFWPKESDPLFALVGRFPFPGSDHRLVWVDLEVEGTKPAATFPGP